MTRRRLRGPGFLELKLDTDEPWKESAAEDVRALERLADRSRKPVEYWGELDPLLEKLDATPGRRRRNQLLQRAAIPLGESRDPAALRFLSKLVRDPHSNWRVSGQAIQGLIRAGPPAAPFVRSLLRDGLTDPGLPWALGEVGSEVDVPLLLPLLHRRGLRLRYNTAMALGHLDGPRAREGLLIAVRDRRLFVRARAIAALRDRRADLELIRAFEQARSEVPWYRVLVRWHLSGFARYLARR